MRMYPTTKITARIFRRLYTALVTLCLAGVFSAQCNAQTSKLDELKFYSRSNSVGFRAYQSDLLDLALEKSRAEFGDYVIHYYDNDLSVPRIKLMVQSGTDINVSFATEWNVDEADKNKVILLDFPVLKGLIGLRELIIHQDSTKKIENITTHEQLYKLSAGLVEAWPDTEILRSNNLKVISADRFENLFKMLSHKRFDYLPLSILESESSLIDFNHANSDLHTSDHTAIYYPLSMFIAVNAEQPRLAKRLQRGLELATQDGSFDALFNAYFSGFIFTIEENQFTTFVMQNPTLSQADNDRITKAFKSTFKDHLTFIALPPATDTAPKK